MTKLEAIRDQAADRLKALWDEASDEIARAIHEVAESAQDEEKTARFRTSFTVTWDLDGDSVTYKLSFGVRKNFESAGECPDPNQPEIRFHPMEKN